MTFSDMMMLMMVEDLAEIQTLRDEINRIKNEYESGLNEYNDISEKYDNDDNYAE